MSFTKKTIILSFTALILSAHGMFAHALDEKKIHVQALTYQSSDFQSGDFVQNLTNYVEDAAPVVEKFHQISYQARSPHVKKSDSEKNAILTQLLPRLSPRELKELITFTLAFRKGDLSKQDYSQYLKELFQEKHIQTKRHNSMEAHFQNWSC